MNNDTRNEPTTEDIEEGKRDVLEAHQLGLLNPDGPSEKEIAFEVEGYKEWLRDQEIKRATHEAAHQLGLCRCGRSPARAD